MSGLGDSKLQGKAEELVGSVKARVGKATKNRRLEAEGLAEQAKGKALQAKHEAQETAGRLGDALRDRVETLLRAGVPAEEVVAVAQEWRADLILVGTHRRGGLARLVLGSVAEGVLRRSPRPVLVVPKGAAPA